MNSESDQNPSIVSISLILRVQASNLFSCHSCYLINAGKDLKWWNKKGGGGADAARAEAEMEKARVKQLDEDLLNEAL